MRYKGEDGAITVFLSIILLIMVTLAGVIVDAARINIAHSQIQRGLETSARSALAGYYAPLREHYGLFTLDENNKENLKGVVKDYLSKNLMIEEESLEKNGMGDYIDLYDYKIESIEVEPIFNLTENPVTRQQILEYMKYRAPKELVHGFLDKLGMFKKAGTTSQVYKKKVEFQRSLKEIENIQREIYKSMYGKYEERMFWIYSQKKTDYYVRNFDKNEYQRWIKDYIDMIYSYKAQQKNLREINSMIRESEGDRKQELKDSRAKIRKRIMKTEGKMTQTYNKITYDINKYFTANKEAKDQIDKLIEKSRSLRTKLNELKGDLEKNKEGIIEEAFNQISAEIEEYNKLLLNIEEGQEPQCKKNDFTKIQEKLERNEKSLLNEEIKKITGILSLMKDITPYKAQRLAKENLDEEKIRGLDLIQKNILDELKKYNRNIEYDYVLKERDPSYEKYDRRKDTQEKANRKINIKGKEGKKINYEDYKVLPSVVKLQLDKEKDIENLFGFLWRDDNKVNEVEFHHQEKLGFGESALSFLGGIMGNIDIEGSLKDIRDEIYINEYIMGTFKNYVSDFDEEEKYNLRHLDKSQQSSYFDTSEVEYILNGNRSEKINQTLTDSKILLTRFCLNSIHVFNSKDKVTLATSIATATSGLYTGGAGIPIIKTLILLSWAMEESILDLDELKEGNEVVLYKSEQDWKSGIKASSKREVPGTKKEDSPSNNKNPMDTSYQDYLRLFLLVQDDEVTIKRVQDLIQLNMQRITDNGDFKLEEYNTYVRVEVVVSIKYLFLTQSFMPKEFKTQDDRHKFKVVIYQGY